MRPWLLSLILLMSGCVLAPRETRQEQRRIDHAWSSRKAPELPAPATWRDVLERAMLSNGDLEAAYFEWKAALARMPQVASWPNSNFAPSFSYMFSGERLKAWDRPMLNGLLNRPPYAAIEIPRGLPPPRQLAADDAKLIAVATDANPQLQRLARQAQGREDALQLARLMYFPDINPTASFTGGISQA